MFSDVLLLVVFEFSSFGILFKLDFGVSARAELLQPQRVVVPIRVHE